MHVCHFRARWPGRPEVIWQLHLPPLLLDDEVEPFQDVSAALLEPFPILQLLTIVSIIWWNAEFIPYHALMVVQRQLQRLAVDPVWLHICHCKPFTLFLLQETHRLRRVRQLCLPQHHNAIPCEGPQVTTLQNLDSHSQWHDYSQCPPAPLKQSWCLSPKKHGWPKAAPHTSQQGCAPPRRCPTLPPGAVPQCGRSQYSL